MANRPCMVPNRFYYWDAFNDPDRRRAGTGLGLAQRIDRGALVWKGRIMTWSAANAVGKIGREYAGRLHVCQGCSAGGDVSDWSLG